MIELQGKKYSDNNLPIPKEFDFSTKEETDIQELKDYVDHNLPLLNKAQKLAFKEILSRMCKFYSKNKLFLLNGPGRSGKTFLYKLLIATLHVDERSVIATASTGIAANLLIGGRTYHLQFKLTLPFLKNSVSLIRATSKDADLISKSDFIIIDEATMATGNVLSAIEKLRRDVTGNNNNLFKGKIILLGGDFRHTSSCTSRK